MGNIMLLSASHHLRCVLAAMIIMVLTTFTTAAQTATEEEPQSTPQVEVVDTETPASPAPESEPERESEIDLSDPALMEALEAREKADRAIAEAVKAQQEKATLQSAASEEETPKKKSFIPTSVDDLKALGQKILDKVIGWLTSISFLAQVGAIVLAIFLSPILAGSLRKRIFLFRDEPQPDQKLKVVRDYIYRSREFLRALLLVALLALFAVILKAVPIAGQDWLVKLAQGLAVVFLIYKAIGTFITNDLVKTIATWTLIPLAVLMVFGYFDNLLDALNAAELMKMGDTPITAMTLVRLAIFGGLFFWLGNMSNTKGQTAIRSQEGLDLSLIHI